MAKQEITCDDILKELRAKQYRPVYYLMGEEPYYIDEIDVIGCLAQEIIDGTVLLRSPFL